MLQGIRLPELHWTSRLILQSALNSQDALACNEHSNCLIIQTESLPRKTQIRERGGGQSQKTALFFTERRIFDTYCTPVPSLQMALPAFMRLIVMSGLCFTDFCEVFINHQLVLTRRMKSY